MDLGGTVILILCSIALITAFSAHKESKENKRKRLNEDEETPKKPNTNERLLNLVESGNYSKPLKDLSEAMDKGDFDGFISTCCWDVANAVADDMANLCENEERPDHTYIRGNDFVWIVRTYSHARLAEKYATYCGFKKS